jgi:hypothetical protein
MRAWRFATHATETGSNTPQSPVVTMRSHPTLPPTFPLLVVLPIKHSLLPTPPVNKDTKGRRRAHLVDTRWNRSVRHRQPETRYLSTSVPGPPPVELGV